MTDPYATGPGPAPAQPLAPNDERLWGSLAQYGNIIGFLPSLLILLILGPRSAFVKRQATEALNFIITVVIAYVALLIVSTILSVVAGNLPSGVGLVVLLITGLIGLVQLAIFIVLVVFSIIQGLKVNRGEDARYPFALRLIK